MADLESEFKFMSHSATAAKNHAGGNNDSDDFERVFAHQVQEQPDEHDFLVTSTGSDEFLLQGSGVTATAATGTAANNNGQSSDRPLIGVGVGGGGFGGGGDSSPSPSAPPSLSPVHEASKEFELQYSQHQQPAGGGGGFGRGGSGYGIAERSLQDFDKFEEASSPSPQSAKKVSPIDLYESMTGSSNAKFDDLLADDDDDLSPPPPSKQPPTKADDPDDSKPFFEDMKTDVVTPPPPVELPLYEEPFDLEPEPEPPKPAPPKMEPLARSTTPSPVKSPAQSPDSSSCNCPFRAWLNPDNFDPRVVELVYWRDPKKSGIVFGSILVALLSLTYFSLISVIAYLSLALLTGTITFRIYKNVLAAVQKSNEGHPFKQYLESDAVISNEQVHEVADAVVAHINAAFHELRRLVLVEDLVDSIKFGVVLWCMTYVGAWFNGMTLIILAFVAIFTMPKVYETNKTQIDHYMGMVHSQASDIIGKVKAKLPIGKKAKEQ